jgi:LysM repeat protein
MGRLRAVLAGLLLGLLALTACSSRPASTVHVVQRGENLYRIAQHYGVSVADIARANGIRD